MLIANSHPNNRFLSRCPVIRSLYRHCSLTLFPSCYRDSLFSFHPPVSFADSGPRRAGAPSPPRGRPRTRLIRAGATPPRLGHGAKTFPDQTYRLRINIKLRSSIVWRMITPAVATREPHSLNLVGGAPKKHPVSLTSLDAGHRACSDHAKSLSSHAGAAGKSMLGNTEETDGVGTRRTPFTRHMVEFLEFAKQRPRCRI